MKNKSKGLKKGRRQEGITLVALVVTIVVLLILAGVSLNLVLSNNGIITKAGEAKEKYGEGKENDQTDLDNGLLWIEENLEGNKNEYVGLTVTSGMQGVVFTKANGTTEGDINNIETGDVVKYGDYEYHYNQSYNSNPFYTGWSDKEGLDRLGSYGNRQD